MVNIHYVKSGRIHSISGPYSRIWTEYNVQSKFPLSFWENTDPLPPPKTNKQTKQKKTRNLNTFHLMVTLDNFLFVPYSWVIELTTDIFELFLINLQAQKWSPPNFASNIMRI